MCYKFSAARAFSGARALLSWIWHGVMNGVLVSTLVRLGFSGTALKPPRIFMYLSLQQFILSNLVLVLRRPWQVFRPSRLVLGELRSSFRVSRTRSVTHGLRFWSVFCLEGLCCKLSVTERVGANSGVLGERGRARRNTPELEQKVHG